jgi:16S rRNA (adenine1518-N6/adenine1519-N6)-dimethyltransferase
MVKGKLGQNFLINHEVAEREINYACLSKDDIILEIGPGEGILTKKLAEKVKQVIAIEIDYKLVKKLNENLPNNVKLIHADALKVDFNSLPAFNKIVANLPFQISSPFTFKLLNYPFSKAVLIYQKDFAERMTAKKGSKKYSRLSVGIYYKTDCRILETVPKESFYPIPKVDSSIVELIPRNKPPFKVLDEKYFFDIVKKLFTHRRKKIKNILFDKSENIKNISYINCRVEDLSPEQIGKLSDDLFKMDY